MSMGHSFDDSIKLGIYQNYSNILETTFFRKSLKLQRLDFWSDELTPNGRAAIALPGFSFHGGFVKWL